MTSSFLPVACIPIACFQSHVLAATLKKNFFKLFLTLIRNQVTVSKLGVYSCSKWHIYPHNDICHFKKHHNKAQLALYLHITSYNFTFNATCNVTSDVFGFFSEITLGDGPKNRRQAVLIMEFYLSRPKL